MTIGKVNNNVVVDMEFISNYYITYSWWYMFNSNLCIVI